MHSIIMHMNIDSLRSNTTVHNESTATSVLSGSTPQNNKDEQRSTLIFVLVIALIVIPIRIFIAKPFVVSGTSMSPTFNTFDYLIVDQLTYRFEEPHRGDVIVFRYPYDTTRFFIKRIIGLPGETVRLDGYTTTIINDTHPEGFVLDEVYVAQENKMTSNMEVALGSDEYFVMGDNRAASADSRYWGALEKKHISGRAFVQLFPFTDMHILPGATLYTTK